MTENSEDEIKVDEKYDPTIWVCTEQKSEISNLDLFKINYFALEIEALSKCYSCFLGIRGCLRSPS